MERRPPRAPRRAWALVLSALLGCWGALPWSPRGAGPDPAAETAAEPGCRLPGRMCERFPPPPAPPGHTREDCHEGNDAEACLWLGVLRHRAGDSAGAAELYGRARDIGDLPWASVGLASIALGRGRLDEAGDFARPVCGDGEPGGPEGVACNILGRVEFAQGDFAAAKEHWTTACRARHPRACSGQSAVTMLERCRAEGNVYSCHNSGRRLYEEGNLETAADHLEAAYYGHGHAAAGALLGRLWRDLGDDAAAGTIWLRLCNDGDFESCHLLGSLARDRKEWDEAFAVWGALCDHNYLLSCHAYGELKERMGHYAEAKRYFKRGCFNNRGLPESCRKAQKPSHRHREKNPLII